MIYIPLHDKAGYDMSLFTDSKKDQEVAKEHLKKLNKQGPRGWRLVPLGD